MSQFGYDNRPEWWKKVPVALSTVIPQNLHKQLVGKIIHTGTTVWGVLRKIHEHSIWMRDRQKQMRQDAFFSSQNSHVQIQTHTDANIKALGWDLSLN